MVRNLAKPLVIPVLALVITACDHDNEEPVAPTSFWDLSAITPTDVNGAPIGNGDEDDWRTDVVFDQTASALFAAQQTSALLPRNDTTNFVACYPNPMSEIAMVTVRSVRPFDRLDLVIADATGDAVWSSSSAVNGNQQSLALDIENIIGSANTGNYRLFYRCSLGDSIMYVQGYGDIRIEP